MHVDKINELKGTIKAQKASQNKLLAQRTQDKMIFVEMLKRERVAFEEKLIDSDKKVLWFEQEMRRVGSWARERQKVRRRARAMKSGRKKKNANDRLSSAHLLLLLYIYIYIIVHAFAARRRTIRQQQIYKSSSFP